MCGMLFKPLGEQAEVPQKPTIKQRLEKVLKRFKKAEGSVS
jgi:hypothetical protein